MKTLLHIWQHYQRGAWTHRSTADRHLGCLRGSLRSGQFGYTSALPQL